MSLIDSNTYIEPTAGTSLNGARAQINNTIRSVLTNFKSKAAPTTVNLTASGSLIGEQDGMLYRSATTNALYISDTVHVKSSPVGGNFTRIGIGNRVENGIVALAANAASYEIGELVATVSATPGLSGNARLYLNIANSTTIADFIDVGIPPTNGSVVNTMIAIGGVTGDRVNYTFYSTNGTSGANAHLKVSTSLGRSTAIALGTSNIDSNISLVKFDGNAGQNVYSGLNIMDRTGVAYAPLAANILLQSTIQGVNNIVAPLIPAGSIIGWAGTVVPAGWLKCESDAVSRTNYAALFAAIGTSYGIGDGATTFNLPNFYGKTMVGATDAFPIGTSSSTTIDATGSITSGSTLQTVFTGTTFVAGTGKDTGSIVALNAINLPAHTHAVAIPSTAATYIIKT